jgi:hypothetical protein
VTPVPPPTQPLRYDLLLQKALRGVLRETLDEVAAKGLPGHHHLYITFRTQAPGVTVPDHLVQRYPDEMTVVLQHEFWGLEVDEVGFQVTLSFNNRGERLTVPFAAVVAFADPSVNFGLQFQPSVAQAAGEQPKAEGERTGTAEHGAKQEAAAAGVGENQVSEAGSQQPGDPKVVTLDRFRRK